MKKIIAIIIIAIIAGAFYLYNQKTPSDEELKEMVLTNYNSFDKTLNETKASNPKIYGNLNNNTSPTLNESLAKRLNAKKVYNNLEEYKKAGEKIPAYKNHNGADLDIDKIDDGCIIVNDNFIIWVNADDSNPENTIFFIDANGAKRPNMLGKDLVPVKLSPNDNLEIIKGKVKK